MEAIYSQKVDYSQQIGGSTPQKMVIVKFKDDSNEDEAVAAQCSICLDNEIGEGKKRKQTQKSVKKSTTDYEEPRKKQKRNKRKNVASSEDETDMEDSQEIKDYAEHDYYMPDKSVEKKKMEKKQLKGKSTMA